jgi:hypothetical protein
MSYPGALKKIKKEANMSNIGIKIKLFLNVAASMFQQGNKHDLNTTL